MLVIGLEGVSSSNFTKLLDNENLPNLNRLVQNGLLGECAMPAHPGPLPRWMSLVTGVYPARHGVMTYKRFNQPEDGFGRNIGSEHWMPTLWDRLARTGQRTIVIGFPGFRFAEPIEGVMIGNALESVNAYANNDSLSGQNSQGNIFYPPEHECELVSTFAQSSQISSEDLDKLFNDYETDPINDNSIQRFLIEALLSTRSRIDLLKKSMQIEPKWRLGVSYIPGLYRLDCQAKLLLRSGIHRVKNFCPERLREDYRKAIRIYWRDIDRMLGSLLLTLSNTTIILTGSNSISMTQTTKDIQINSPFDEDDDPSGAGFVLLSGISVAKDQIIYGARVVDIAPTILMLLGVDCDDKLDGRPLGLGQQSALASSANINSHNFVSNRDQTASISEEMRAEIDRIKNELKIQTNVVIIGQYDRNRRRILLDQVVECADWLRVSGLSVEATSFLRGVFDLVPDSFCVGARLLRFLLARNLDGSVSLEEMKSTFNQVLRAYEGLPLVAKASDQGQEMRTLSAAVDEIENRTVRLNAQEFTFTDAMDRTDLTRLRIAAEQALLEQDYTSAKLFLRTLAKQKLSSVWPLLQLSKLAVEEDDLDGAISYAKAAIIKRYGTPNAHYIIGYVQYKRKQYLESIISLERALQLAPELPSAIQLLAHIKALIETK